jgi:hypothetical protein
MADPYGTEPMFEIPEKYKSQRSRKPGVAWRKHAGRITSCDACIMALHRHEVTFAPTPASNVRDENGERRYFCAEHTVIQKAEDRRQRKWSG